MNDFELWAVQGRWTEFHSAHYDWWTFPLDESSGAYGFAYAVYEGEVAVLKQDTAFMRDLVRDAELVAASWGWNLRAGGYIANPAPEQRWHEWPVRLSKAARSMQLFGLDEPFDSLKTYARILIGQGKSMKYGAYDVS